MTITITIEAPTALDARAQMLELLGTATSPITTAPDVPLEQPPKGRAPRAAKSEATPPTDTSQKPSDTSTEATTAAPDGSADGASPSEPGAADGQWDYATQIKPAVLKVSQKHGRSGVEELLKPFEVTNAQQIPAERYGELMAAIDKLLEA